MKNSRAALAAKITDLLTRDFNADKPYGELTDEVRMTDVVRTVALTFDDGPSKENTGKLLDFLKTEKIPAVFFVVGGLLATTDGKRLVKRAYDEGHIIGNHSYTHADLTKLTKAEVEKELSQTHDLIAAITGKCTLFRPPYGAVNETVRSAATKFGYQIALWSVDTEDWKFKDDRWVEKGIEQIKTRTNSIVLMHDIHKTTVDRVPDFVKRIRQLGSVKFVQM